MCTPVFTWRHLGRYVRPCWTQTLQRKSLSLSNGVFTWAGCEILWDTKNIYEYTLSCKNLEGKTTGEDIFWHGGEICIAGLGEKDREKKVISLIWGKRKQALSRKTQKMKYAFPPHVDVRAPSLQWLWSEQGKETFRLCIQKSLITAVVPLPLRLTNISQ